jgi:hypothetical protein
MERAPAERVRIFREVFFWSVSAMVQSRPEKFIVEESDGEWREIRDYSESRDGAIICLITVFTDLYYAGFGKWVAEVLDAPLTMNPKLTNLKLLIERYEEPEALWLAIIERILHDRR